LSSLCFITWTRHHRATEIARVLGAELYEPFTARTRWPAPIRYVVQAGLSVAYLARKRPHAVLTSNPPFVAALTLLTVRRLMGARVWSDTHSGAFNDERWARFGRANAWVLRRCDGVLVTTHKTAQIVADMGGRPLVLNYPGTVPKSRVPSSDPLLVATVGYRFDEPLLELVEAARQVPEMKIVFPGDAPRDLRNAAPANCRFTGWLARDQYEDLIASCRGVVCLTTRENTMQTGAYEALEYGLPMLLSGTQALRSFYGEGVLFVDSHEPDDLAAGLRRLWHEHESLAEAAIHGRETLLARCREEVAALREALARA
jgi:glycosyltransferase involved in cell wall biosynthesis